MRSSVTFALVVLALPAVAQAPKWTTFAPKGEGFSVLMPSPPKLTTQNEEGVLVHIYISQAPPFVAIVSKAILPPTFKKPNVDIMVKTMREGMLRTSGSTATGDHKTVHGGLTGEQTDFKTPSGGTGLLWVVRKPKAVYALAIVGQKPLGTADAKRFLDSFRIR